MPLDWLQPDRAHARRLPDPRHPARVRGGPGAQPRVAEDRDRRRPLRPHLRRRPDLRHGGGGVQPRAQAARHGRGRRRRERPEREHARPREPGAGAGAPGRPRRQRRPGRSHRPASGPLRRPRVPALAGDGGRPDGAGARRRHPRPPGGDALLAHHRRRGRRPGAGPALRAHRRVGGAGGAASERPDLGRGHPAALHDPHGGTDGAPELRHPATDPRRRPRAPPPAESGAAPLRRRAALPVGPRRAPDRHHGPRPGEHQPARGRLLRPGLPRRRLPRRWPSSWRTTSPAAAACSSPATIRGSGSRC